LQFDVVCCDAVGEDGNMGDGISVV